MRRRNFLTAMGKEERRGNFAVDDLYAINNWTQKSSII